MWDLTHASQEVDSCSFNPTAAWETVLFPVIELQASVTEQPWEVIGNRGIATPGSVVRNIELTGSNVPDETSALKFTISACDVVEPVYAVDVAVIVTGALSEGGEIVQRRYSESNIALVNGKYTYAQISFRGEKYNFRNCPDAKSSFVHVTVRFHMRQQFFN